MADQSTDEDFERFFAERRERADYARALEIMNRAGGEPPREDDRI